MCFELLDHRWFDFSQTSSFEETGQQRRYSENIIVTTLVDLGPRQILSSTRSASKTCTLGRLEEIFLFVVAPVNAPLTC
jgi:hypothetical protein